MSRSAPPLTGAFLLLLTGVSAPNPSSAQPVPTTANSFGLVLHVGSDAHGAPAATSNLLQQWVDAASTHFSPAGISFAIETAHPLPDGSDELHTIRDRHRLSRHLVEHHINVFFVSLIEDPHASRTTQRQAARQGITLSGRLGGAHIVARGHVPETFIIIRTGRDPTALAHELGHFFGAGHHGDPENIMSYGRDRHRFDERQMGAFRHFARRYVRRRVLRRL